MSFNGLGVFSINTSGQPVVGGTTISSSVFNTLMADVAAGLSTCITKDGQQVVTANIPMGGYKITGLAAATTNGDAVRWEQLLAYTVVSCNDMRLTLTALTPVTTTDVTAAVTLYWARYKGSRVALFNGTAWEIWNTGDINIAIPAVANQMYDVWAYNNAGVVALELTAWTNDTTRATALVMQNGVYVKTGDLTRRYLGSFRTTAVAGQSEDSLAKRYVWNYANRVRRPMKKAISATIYSYTSATVRQAAGTATNQLDLVVGVSEDVILARILGNTSNTTTVGATFSVGVGVDSTTVISADSVQTDNGASLVAGYANAATADYAGYPGIGRHTLAWLEAGDGTANQFWNSKATNCIRGEIWG